MRQNDDIALRPQWPSLLSVVSRAHMLRSSLHSNWTNFKSLHNNHTNLYDCRRNKFYMIADVTNFAWLQKKRINFNTRWKHDNSSNKQLWPRWWRAPTWSTPQCALVMHCLLKRVLILRTWGPGGYRKWHLGCPNQNSKTTFQYKYPGIPSVIFGTPMGVPGP